MLGEACLVYYGKINPGSHYSRNVFRFEIEHNAIDAAVEYCHEALLALA
jgi:hypothetical protein